jgi:hypothetical protein
MASAQSSSSLTGAPKASEISAASSNLNDIGVVDDDALEVTKPVPDKTVTPKKASSLNGLIDSFLSLISSVPFGIVLLILLIIACMIGMLIQQQELETFTTYYGTSWFF